MRTLILALGATLALAAPALAYDGTKCKAPGNSSACREAWI